MFRINMLPPLIVTAVSEGRQKEVLKRIAGQRNIQRHLPALFPEYQAALASYLSPADAEWVYAPSGMPAAVIARLRRAAKKFVPDYEPSLGRPADHTLEEAVTAMREMLVSVLGHELRVASNKNNGLAGPTPRCVGAAAIDTILRHVDPALTTTAIMNMVVSAQNGRTSAVAPMDALMDVNPISALDASLLPNRHEVIRALPK